MSDTESIIFSLISLGGNAKGLAYEALEAAENQEYSKAEELLKEADQQILEAHHVQAELIKDETAGKKVEVSLLMVHAQDHLMSAIQALELIEAIIRLNKKLDAKDDK